MHIRGQRNITHPPLGRETPRIIIEERWSLYFHLAAKFGVQRLHDLICQFILGKALRFVLWQFNGAKVHVWTIAFRTLSHAKLLAFSL